MNEIDFLLTVARNKALHNDRRLCLLVEEFVPALDGLVKHLHTTYAEAKRIAEDNPSELLEAVKPLLRATTPEEALWFFRLPLSDRRQLLLSAARGRLKRDRTPIGIAAAEAILSQA